MYTVIDILDKIIEIEKKSWELYRMLQENNTISQQVKLAASVFAREEERHIKIYQGIIEEMTELEDIQIDFDIYDKTSKIITEFRKGLTHSESDDVKQLLESSLDFEQRNLALIIRIQGLLVRKSEDVETNSYKAITRVIQEEEEHIRAIEMFLK